MTTSQINHELSKIRKNSLTYNEYIRLSRVGETFKMSRKDKRMVYNIYLEQKQKVDEERRFKLENRISKEGLVAYDAITKYRDEVLLISA